MRIRYYILGETKAAAMHFMTNPNTPARERTHISWGVAQLAREPACFQSADRAKLRVIPLQLPSGRSVPSPSLHFVPRGSHTTFVAMLALGHDCRATGVASQLRQKFDIWEFDGAEVDNDGRVTLCSRAHFYAVEINRARISAPSELDWCILQAFIAARGAEDQCYRSALYGLEPQLAAQMLKLAAQRRIDFARLSQLQPDLIKRDLDAVRKQNPELDISSEKLAQTLAIMGSHLCEPAAGLRYRV
jgi:hypothetical protein